MKALGMLLLLCGMASSAMARPVPEVDPSSATSAIALVAGGLMIWRAKRQK